MRSASASPPAARAGSHRARPRPCARRCRRRWRWWRCSWTRRPPTCGGSCACCSRTCCSSTAARTRPSAAPSAGPTSRRWRWARAARRWSRRWRVTLRPAVSCSTATRRDRRAAAAGASTGRGRGCRAGRSGWPAGWGRAMSPRRSARPSPTRWTFPAESSARRASETTRRCRLSPRRCDVQTKAASEAATQGFGAWPDAQGHFGRYGGVFVPDTLIEPLRELEAAYRAACADPAFQAELEYEYRHYVGRPSPVYEAKRLSEKVGGARILLKREDLNHTGAHKINNTIGQAMLARRMGKTRIIAETGAGQHGVASATVAARLGLECVVYMGATDVERQAPNVFRMKLLGATVVPVQSGSRT